MYFSGPGAFKSLSARFLVWLSILITVLTLVLIYVNARHVEKTIGDIGMKTGLVREEIRELQREKIQGFYLMGMVIIVLIGLSAGLIVIYYRYSAGTMRLKDLERRQDSLLAAVARGVIIVNGKGDLVTLNQSAANILGLTGTNPGSRAVKILPPGAQTENFLNLLLREGPEPRDIEILTRDGQGNDQFVKMSGTRIYDHRNRHVGGAIFLQDITEMKKLMVRARINEHLSAIGRIAEGVSHEIRKPLNAIQIHLQLLREHLEQDIAIEDDQTERYVNTIINEVGHLNRTLSDFNEYSLASMIIKSPVDLHPLLEEIVLLYSPELKKRGVGLKSCLAAATHLVLGDRDKLQEVFSNLLMNAFESTGADGEVTIETETEENQSFVAVMFRDTGYGIPLENLEKIFNIYFTTKEGGNGLGLTIASRIVHQHGGTIDAISWLGEGSLFTVRLPLAKLET